VDADPRFLESESQGAVLGSDQGARPTPSGDDATEDLGEIELGAPEPEVVHEDEHREWVIRRTLA
jgi:hypothetical protein